MDSVQHGRWDRRLDWAASLLVIAAAVIVLWNQRSPSTADLASGKSELPLPSALQTLDGAHLKGSSDASVAMIVYSDFQCPFCGKFARSTLPQLDQEYIQPGKVALAFRHSPIERIHPLALKAAEAAECASRAGRFWEMHDALFLKEATLETSGLLKAAQIAGVNVAETEACLAEDGSARIRADRAAAEALGFTGTPISLFGTIEAGGVRVTNILKGARPYEEVSAILADLLARGRR